MKGLKLLNTAQVCELLGKAPQTLQNWRSIGTGPKFIKVGRDVRYREADIIEWLESNVYTETGLRSA
ncbi:helix-turn-helix transcriptional regulator [Endozoicomonas acroporae]|uniref:helix-turn-helix transcriptional regulator n=1 Tax=Endozoicomonas acroporae TaxID=1701104 RepID=UPI0013D85597|nr:helix-turn-helix domain-containing protein [Endozoicomonas acroporae]